MESERLYHLGWSQSLKQKLSPLPPFFKESTELNLPKTILSDWRALNRQRVNGAPLSVFIKDFMSWTSQHQAFTGLLVDGQWLVGMLRLVKEVLLLVDVCVFRYMQNCAKKSMVN